MGCGWTLLLTIGRRSRNPDSQPPSPTWRKASRAATSASRCQSPRSSDHSPVTIADREIEHEMRRLITATFPHDGIYGEEEGGGCIGQPAALGALIRSMRTMSFIAGMPTFGTLVAFVDDGVPAVGVIDMPVLGERWVGVKGKPTTWNGEVCRTRACRRLDEALISTTSPDMFGAEDWTTFQTLSRAARIRRFGGDCYAYGLLASGCIDIVMEAGLKPYDYLALAPVIEGAGGFITGWRGEPLGMASDGRRGCDGECAASRRGHFPDWS